MSAPARARSTDPDTSHEAAASIDIRGRKQRILGIITDRGSKGTTLDDLEDALPGLRMVSYSSIPARLDEDGLIHATGTRVGRSGRGQKVWFPGFGLDPVRYNRRQRALAALEELARSAWAMQFPDHLSALRASVRGGSK